MTRHAHAPLRMILLATLLAIAALGFMQRETQSQVPPVDVEPAVFDAFQTSPEVSVIVSLVDVGGPGQPNPTAIQDNVAERQANVLAAVSPPDFSLSYQYENIAALSGVITSDGLTTLQSHVDVVGIALNRPMFPALAESVPLIRADQVHAGGLDGTGIKVAVIDTGIDTDHEDLEDSLIGEECTLAEAFCGLEHPAEDTRGHGTAISGAITSNGTVAPKGVADGAQVFAYKACCDLGGFDAVLAALDRVFNYNLANPTSKLRLINISLGDGVAWAPGTCEGQYNQAITNGIRWLRDLQGTLVFAATGNEGDKDGLAFPACLNDVISVGAVYDGDVGSIEWRGGFNQFVCTDATTTADQVGCGSQSSAALDLLAPGSLILSSFLDGGTIEGTGTSFSSPHAVGVAALLLQALPGLTPDEIESVLEDTGVLVTDSFDPNNIRTTPRVDAAAAVLEDDFDLDGCSNGEEFGDNEALGGLRDPEDIWDFYDVWTHPLGDPNLWVRDKFIDLFNDIFEVNFRFGMSGNALADPLVPPPPGTTAYHPSFDRSPGPGPNTWNMGPPDGTIDLFTDIFGVAGQFGHNCTAAP